MSNPSDNGWLDLTSLLPGVLGSAVSMLFIDEPLLRRLLTFAGGATLARFGTGWFARTSGLDAGFTGFLLGLFGMVIVGKLFAAWDTLELSLIVRDWVRKVLGLPTKEGA